MNHLRENLSKAWLFAVALAVTLCVAPTLAHAAGRTVQLRAEGGSVSQSQVALTDDDRLPSDIPEPTKTGWNFIGWFTAPVEYTRWEERGDFNGGRIELPDGYTVDPKDGESYTYDNDYWSWLAKTSGEKVKAGDVVDSDVGTLYACFEPTKVVVKYHWNGWGWKWGTMTATRDYDMAVSPVVKEAFPGHDFLGWYTDRRSDEGTKWGDYDFVTSPETDVYAHYSGMADDPEVVHQNMIAAQDINVSASITTIEPAGGAATLSAKLSMDNSVVIPTAEDWANVKWAITSGQELAKLSTGSGQSCTVTALDKGTGTVTVVASFLTEGGVTRTATTNITVMAHEHQYGAETVIQKPTCQTAGYATKVCKICSQTVRRDLPKTDHVYKLETKVPTCTSAGSERNVCTVCGHVDTTKTLAATGHDFVEKVIDSCTGRTVTKTCRTCGHIETTEGAGTGAHSWESTWTVDQKPTCQTPGSKSIHCANCGLTKDSTEIPVTDHVFGGWHTTKPATATAKGEQERECTFCHKTEVKELPVLVGGSTGETTPEEQLPESKEPEPQEPESQEPEPQPVVETATTYHLVNPYNGEHLYTTSYNEFKTNVGLGWQEKSSAKVPEKSAHPVYRLYNEYTHEHHYTMDRNEYNTLSDLGWNGEGVMFYSDEAMGTPVYRYFKGVEGEGTHVYVEKAEDIAYYESLGWRSEGISWYYLA